MNFVFNFSVLLCKNLQKYYLLATYRNKYSTVYNY